MIGAWRRLRDDENDAAWDDFDRRFGFAPSGGRPARSIREPAPSVTFDLSGLRSAGGLGYADAAIGSVEASARRAFLAAFGEDVELLVLDWQHHGYRLSPAVPAAGPDDLPPIPTVVPDGDYYIYATPDLSEGTFGHPWENSLCVFGSRMARILGAELRTWLPVMREQQDEARAAG